MNKFILILLFDVQGAVYQYIVPRHTAINALYYHEVVRTLKRQVNKKGPNLKKFYFCVMTMLSRTPLSSPKNFWKKEKLKFLHTLCTVKIVE